MYDDVWIDIAIEPKKSGLYRVRLTNGADEYKEILLEFDVFCGWQLVLGRQYLGWCLAQWLKV